MSVAPWYCELTASVGSACGPRCPLRFRVAAALRLLTLLRGVTGRVQHGVVMPPGVRHVTFAVAYTGVWMTWQ